MRRARLVRPVDTTDDKDHLSVPDALFFDIIAPHSMDEDSLAEWRLGSVQHMALLLGATHLLVGLACLLLMPSRSYAPWIENPLVPAILVILLDVAAATVPLLRKRIDVASRTIFRSLIVYLALSSALWAWFSAAVSDDHSATPFSAMPIALGAGFAISSIVSISSPPLAIVNMAAMVIAAAILAPSPLVTTGVAILSAALICYSIAGTRNFIATGRRRLQLESQSRKAQHFVDEFENSGRGWFWETDCLGTLSYVSQQLADDFKSEPESLLGRQFTDLLSVDDSRDTIEERKTLGFHLSARFPFSDVVVRPASDEDVHWSLSGNPIFDDRGRFHGFRGIGNDLTEQRRSQQEITRLARFDSLTALPNRAMMRQTLEEALRNAAHRRKGCALFMIDLDRFKNVNDTLGHPIGDALLRQVSDRLKSVMGNHGQVGRLGGDEFQAVLPGTVDVGLLESLARTMIEHVSRPYAIEGHKVQIGASIGVVIGDAGRTSADAMVRNADLALYAAKSAGRGKHRMYEASMHSEAADRQLMESDLRQAIDRGELSVAYQPIVYTGSEEVSGFESLVRWQHPVRGAVCPSKFVPLAEEAGLIGRIGEWVLETALHEAAKWPDHVRIAVNLSPLQFNDPGVVDMVAAQLRASGVRAERLELEITEGVFLAEGDTTDETFARLKKLGVRLALDDFGTGYSSLGYLKKAPFDKIKIDQSFVRGAASTSKTNRNAAIIRAIVTLAETLGMDSCAEGVETHDDLQLIRELGVSMVQGYIFGQPAPPEVARELANRATVEADGFQCSREPRYRLMRRAITTLGRETAEVRLRNISSMGALVECSIPVSPGTALAMDIVGVGPVQGLVRWSQEGRFGISFVDQFDLGLLAPKKRNSNEVTMMRPTYMDREAS